MKRVARQEAESSHLQAASFHEEARLSAAVYARQPSPDSSRAYGSLEFGEPRADPPPAQRLNVRTITTYVDFLALEGDWRRLEEISPEATVFQRFGWCRAWIEAVRAVGLPETLRIVTIRVGPQLVAVWPLTLMTLCGVRLARWLGEPATQYGDVLIQPSTHRASWLAAALEEIMSWRDIDGLDLRRVRADAAVANLPKVSKDANLVLRASAPYVDFDRLPPNWRESFGRGGRTRNALRRHLRRLEEVGPVDFKVLESTSDKLEAVSQALAFKQRWLAAKGHMSAGHSHPANFGFLCALAEQGELVVARLGVGGVAGAFEIGMVVRGERYYSMLQSYDLRFAAYGPGQLLLWRVLAYQRESGISIFDFLAPAQIHKKRWASGEILVGDYFVAFSLEGAAMKFAFRHFKPALRWAFERLPGAAKRAVSQAVDVRLSGQK